MILVLIGAAIGAAIGIGRLPVLEGVGGAVADGATKLGYDAMEALLKMVGAPADNTTVIVLKTVMIALMPGIVAGVLMGCARGGVVLRRIGALFTLLAAGWVLISQDMPESLIGAGVLVVVGLLFAFVVGSTLSLVASATSALIATAQIRLAISGDVARYTESANLILSKVGVGDIDLWTKVLAGSGAILPVLVLWAALRD
jgi:hypothetical protein